MSNPGQYGPPDYEALYRASVIERLEKLDQRVEELVERIDERHNEITKELSHLKTNISVVEAVLRVKAGIWGAGSGVAAGLLMVLIFLLTKVIK
jgi:hypothetical protein